MEKFKTIWHDFKALYKKDLENNSCSPIVQHLKESLISFAEQNKIMRREDMEHELVLIDGELLYITMPKDFELIPVD